MELLKEMNSLSFTVLEKKLFFFTIEFPVYISGWPRPILEHKKSINAKSYKTRNQGVFFLKGFHKRIRAVNLLPHVMHVL